MELEEVKKMANEYAISLLSDEIEKVESAFISGYQAAIKDMGASESKKVIDVDGVTFYDLGLPSGLLWSEPLKYVSEEGKEDFVCIPYCDAKKYELPTYHNYVELVHNTRLKSGLLGVNGNTYPAIRKTIWLKNEEKTNVKSYKALYIGLEKIVHYENAFAGDSLYVVIVKNKADL